MGISKLHILPTDNTPEVLLNPEGFIKIKGRGMVANKTSVPEEIINWLDAYLINPAETTDVIIAFEYLNSYSTTILATTLKKISQVTQQNKKFVIHWYYEEEDYDIFGKIGHIDHPRSFLRDHAYPAAKDHPKLTSFFASFLSQFAG